VSLYLDDSLLDSPEQGLHHTKKKLLTSIHSLWKLSLQITQGSMIVVKSIVTFMAQVSDAKVMWF
jgi:hypothetical protein